MCSPVAATEYSRSANLDRNSVDENTPSLCSSHHVPPFSPMVGIHPSPYRASTAAAFADINRALDVRSLRNSVYTNFQADQAPSKVTTSPRPNHRSISLSMRRADSSTIPNQPGRPCQLAGMRSRSLPDHRENEMGSESGSEQLTDGDGDGMHHASCAIPGGGVKVAAEGQVRFPISEMGGNRPPGRRSRATHDAVISQNGKRSSKRTRATTCLIM
ncbi:hypothetical protein ACGC1H_001364 [Rhizoctonia solani]